MKKKLSIIIPFYNSSKTLPKLLESIVKANNNTIDIVVVDDKSVNNEKIKAKNIIEEINKKTELNIIFLENKTLIKSAGTCRNIGLNSINSHWVLFADSDDFFIDGWFEEVSRFFQSNNDIVFFSPISIDLNSGLTSDRHLPFKEMIDNNLLNIDGAELKLRAQFVVPWSKLFRLKFLQENNFVFDEIITSNDVMFSLKTGLKAHAIAISNKNIYCVTKGEGSLTTYVTFERLKARLEVIERYNNFLYKNLHLKEVSPLLVGGAEYLKQGIYNKLKLNELISLVNLYIGINLKVLKLKIKSRFK